uniref:coagulation factor XI-like n=1 Tax=Scatophagus argus TaxID=75038 RepID=UPI001ED7E706|nr:coagulation factor XI-like [Scatophagus argus]
MATHFILVGLLCLCGLSQSNDCKRELLVNVDFPGADIASLFSPDAEHCQQLCTQHSSCLFFSFLRHDWAGDNRQFHCYLKFTSSGKPKVETSLLGITSGFSLKACNPDPQPCLSQVYHHVNFPGGDYRTLFTADYEECQKACTSDPACQFFTFLDENFTTADIRYKCYLKFSWPVPRIPIIKPVPVIVSGFSQQIQMPQNHYPACEVKLFPNSDFPIGNIDVLPATSPEHCQTFCSAHPLCTYFTYISHSFNCYLKNNAATLVLKAVKGYTSGLPARFCQPHNDWIKKTYVGLDFPSSDIRYFPTNDVEGCQRACTEDNNCQFYSYITNINRCYLKRVITVPAPPRVVKEANTVSGFSLRDCYKDIVPTIPVNKH